MAYKLVCIGKPTAEELKSAISRLSDDSQDSYENLQEDVCIILGEACCLLEDEGKSEADVISHLMSQGLSMDSAETVIEKAKDILDSNDSKILESLIKSSSERIDIENKIKSQIVTEGRIALVIILIIALAAIFVLLR